MKLLYCTACGDMVAPTRINFLPRACACGRHQVWWIDGERGIVRVRDGLGLRNAACIIGIANDFLQYPRGHSAESVQIILANMPDTYLFKAHGSLVVRYRPGESADSAYEDELPSPAEKLLARDRERRMIERVNAAQD